MPTPTNAGPSFQDGKGVGNTSAFDQITETGTYVCNWSGHLLRLPEDAVKPGRSPVIDMRGKEQLFVTKISQDPFISLTKARIIASDLDQEVNF